MKLYDSRHRYLFQETVFSFPILINKFIERVAAPVKHKFNGVKINLNAVLDGFSNRYSSGVVVHFRDPPFNPRRDAFT